MDLTQSYIKEILNYNPDTGIFIWKISPNNQVSSGSVAGSAEVDGNTSYVRIGINRRRYAAHRLAFLYMTGSLPKTIIDHKDGNGLNNKWDNLRECTSNLNHANSRKSKNNTIGYKGVNYGTNKSRNKKWRSMIYCDNKQIYLGTFNTPEEAARAYDRKAIEIFGEFAATNFPRSDYGDV